ncbi:hypothetical protein PAMA_008293 [Pampus argenteus]
MDRELVRQSQSEHGEATNGTSPQTSTTTTDSSTPVTPVTPVTPLTPTPPRLTPNPMLLDSPAPTLTPTTSSPPPPLTPAPSVSAAHGLKAASAVAGSPSPHILVPAPPKLTSTASPALRTYSRTILPSATSVSKTCPPTQTSSSFSSSSSAPAAATTASPLLSSSSATHSNVTTSTKASTTLTNGNTRPVSTPSSTPITPFHTPASPPGRQVSQSHPVGTPGLVRANQSPTPVRQRVSQQTLLLGKGLKGSGHDQVLLRAQMLQSLTLRPPPPGALTIPPSLRLKPPSSAPPPLSRPHVPLFPPLRPRPQPSAMATESPTTPSRHLSVPPPTLYSPVRAVPLRPRLHSPRAASPRQSSTLQPIAAAPTTQASPIGRPLAGPKSCPLSQTMHGPGQSQHGSIPVTNPVSATSRFDPSPSAARQLQIIALSSGRQLQPGTYASPELSSQSKRTLSSEDVLPLPLNPSMPKTTSPLPSPPSLLSPASPPSQAGSQTQTLVQKGGEAKESEEQRERGRGLRQGIKDEGQDLREEKDDQRKKGKDERQRLVAEMEGSLVSPKKEEAEPGGEEEQMEVTEEGQSEREKREGGEEKKMEEEEEEGETAMDQSENTTSPVLNQYQNLDPNPTPDASQRLPELPRDLQPAIQEDCENMSTQSDNQSALSSLSSQSPPCSPFIVPSVDLPQPAHPADLSLPQPENADKTGGESQGLAETEAELLNQSEDESESFSQPLSGSWEPKPWPEGRQVLTHLVEGFVIQEGLQPFPVNRSSLLVPEQVTKPQEVNGTNGKAAPPVTQCETAKQTEPSTDSEEEEGGDTDDPETMVISGTAPLGLTSDCLLKQDVDDLIMIQHAVLQKSLFCHMTLFQPRDLWSAGRREKKGKEKVTAAEEEEEEEEEEDEDMEEGGEEEDDDGGEEDPAVAMTARMDRRAARRARRASAPAVTTSTPTSTFKPAPSQWSVEEVTAFIHTLPGDSHIIQCLNYHQMTCGASLSRLSQLSVSQNAESEETHMSATTKLSASKSLKHLEEKENRVNPVSVITCSCSDVAEAFRLQEIDGQALLLLTEDHLMTSMNIKLGPALKICAHINALKNQ